MSIVAGKFIPLKIIIHLTIVINLYQST